MVANNNLRIVIQGKNKEIFGKYQIQIDSFRTMVWSTVADQIDIDTFQ